MPQSTSSTTALWIEDFLLAKIGERWTERAIETYRWRLYRFRDWLGDRPLNRHGIRAYLASMQEDDRLSDYTVAMYFKDVGIFCRWCVAEKYLGEAPTDKITVNVPETEAASYSEEQIEKLLAAANVRDYAIICVLTDTGLRASELCRMQRSDIDWSDGHFTVLCKGRETWDAWLELHTLDAIRDYLKTRTDDDPHLWYGKKGPLKKRGLHAMLHRLATQAGIRGEVRRLCHSFRSSFAKFWLMEPGGDLASLAQVGRWKDLDMPRHYGKLNKQQQRAKKRQVNPLGRVLKRKDKNE